MLFDLILLDIRFLSLTHTILHTIYVIAEH
jgi:hypothetical protein